MSAPVPHSPEAAACVAAVAVTPDGADVIHYRRYASLPAAP